MAGLDQPTLADVLDGKAEAHVTHQDQDNKVLRCDSEF